MVAPASTNTVAKLATGIADKQALTQVGEAIGTLGLPVVVFPRVNAAHARHPVWRRHIAALREADVHLVTARTSGPCTSHAPPPPVGTCRGERCWKRSTAPWKPRNDGSSTALICGNRGP
ncbi:flavoprotein [Streptomyces sp. NPDC059743]|uniref:flavoprotein n=1 Tax=Streptomyces sp. NPDC059743 TaxID=3346928 RepID=UPI00364ED936